MQTNDLIERQRCGCRLRIAVGLFVGMLGIGIFIFLLQPCWQQRCLPKPRNLNDRSLLFFASKYRDLACAMLEPKNDFNKIGSYNFSSDHGKFVASEILKSFTPIKPAGSGRIPDENIDYIFVFATPYASLCFRINCANDTLLLSVSEYMIEFGMPTRKDYKYVGGNKNHFLDIVNNRLEREKITFERSSFIVD